MSGNKSQWQDVIDYALSLPLIKAGLLSAMTTELESECLDDEMEDQAAGDGEHRGRKMPITSEQVFSVVVVVICVSIMAFATKLVYCCSVRKRKLRRVEWHQGLNMLLLQNPGMQDPNFTEDSPSFALPYNNWSEEGRFRETCSSSNHITLHQLSRERSNPGRFN